MLRDCIETGRHTELFIVEGLSAADALAAARDPRRHAIHALQGKLPNARRGSLEHLRRHPACAALFETLGCGVSSECDAGQLRFGHVLIAMDPNSDGAHCRLLTLALLERCLHPLLADRRITVVAPPQLRIRARDSEPASYACTAEEVRRVEDRVAARSIALQDVTRFRGLAQLDPDELRRFVLDPATRREHLMTV